MELNQEQKELAEAMAGIVAGKTAAVRREYGF